MHNPSINNLQFKRSSFNDFRSEYILYESCLTRGLLFVLKVMETPSYTGDKENDLHD